MIKSFATTQTADHQATKKAPGYRSLLQPTSQISSLPHILVQRKANCPCGGVSPGCQDGAADLIQTKLRINKPGDKYEQEANQIAGQVVRMPAPQAERKASPSRHKEDKVIQTKPVDSAGLAQTAETPLIQGMQLPSGQPLDAATRNFMEPRFGHDFGRVRVHTDREAAESARALDARAYTVGQDVVFGEGQYAPSTDTGSELLAHELTHVIQQRHTPMIQRLIVGTTPGALPTGTTVHRGATRDAEWLQGHRNAGNPISEFVLWVAGVNWLSSQTTQDIATRCNALGSFQDKLLCLHDEVHAAVQVLEASDGNPNDSDYVCRNYAAALHDVSQQMGLSPDLETSTTHAWVEFSDNSRQYVIDAYNQIMFSYPK